ncbi:MAG: helix-turn-helix domain-containing protein [archaeon]
MNQKLSHFLGTIGLTEYEAKTLATLFRLKEAESPLVAAESQVPKTRVYDVLDTLVEKGLVVEIASRPKKYRAMKANEVFGKLLAEKQGELSQWNEEARIIAAEIETQREGEPSNEEKVLKVKSRTDFYKILAQEMDTAHERITGLTRLDAHHHILHDSLKRATERNVSIKLTGEHPEGFKEKMATYGENIHLQDATHGMHAYVIDGKKVIMLLSDLAQDRPEYHFAIWPENTAMAQTLEHTFQRHWNE